MIQTMFTNEPLVAAKVKHAANYYHETAVQSETIYKYFKDQKEETGNWGRVLDEILSSRMFIEQILSKFHCTWYNGINFYKWN